MLVTYVHPVPPIQRTGKDLSSRAGRKFEGPECISVLPESDPGIPSRDDLATYAMKPTEPVMPGENLVTGLRGFTGCFDRTAPSSGLFPLFDI